jgi:hypothetical protein
MADEPITGEISSSEMQKGIEFAAFRHQVNQFFEGMAKEMSRPSFGDRDRDIYKNFLIRAQEAKIYEPEVI